MSVELFECFNKYMVNVPDGITSPRLNKIRPCLISSYEFDPVEHHGGVIYTISQLPSGIIINSNDLSREQRLIFGEYSEIPIEFEVLSSIEPISGEIICSTTSYFRNPANKLQKVNIGFSDFYIDSNQVAHDNFLIYKSGSHKLFPQIDFDQNLREGNFSNPINTSTFLKNEFRGFWIGESMFVFSLNCAHLLGAKEFIVSNDQSGWTNGHDFFGGLRQSLSDGSQISFNLQKCT